MLRARSPVCISVLQLQIMCIYENFVEVNFPEFNNISEYRYVRSEEIARAMLVRLQISCDRDWLWNIWIKLFLKFSYVYLD